MTGCPWFYLKIQIFIDELCRDKSAKLPLSRMSLRKRPILLRLVKYPIETLTLFSPVSL